jgi:arylsulfatase
MERSGPGGSFGGRIGPDVAGSEPWWPEPPRPPRAAPNIVMVVLDDVGFAQLGCYGGDIATPTLDALAGGGLRYRNFHTTALCSPTRACLLTGRNHHAVGMGLVANFDNGFPGYRGYVAHEAATIAELLRDAGYATYCVGKWHLVPPRHTGPIGPFGHWPLGRGFDHYYGFLHGKTNQWVPTLWEDNHSVPPPATPGYHLTEDLVDRSLGYLRGHLSANSARPFFLYLAFGACHDPHHAPTAYIERYTGCFDDGWDSARQRILARQEQIGCVPVGTRLAPPNPGVPMWAELSADERRLFSRMQEVFAGFLTHADDHLGRLVGFLRDNALLEGTMLVALSDNGASMEGGRYGYVSPPFRSGRFPTLADNLAQLPLLGGPLADNHYPAGWAQAGNTPLKYYKMYAHGGGIRAPLIVHWPARITSGGGWREQYHHAVDVAPTILEELGLSAPAQYRGVAQMPLHGTSMAYTFDDQGAPTRKDQQYYEIHGHRGLWHRGWKAVACHRAGMPFSDDRWELYHVDADFSECTDLAAENPTKLAELVARWWAEAGRNGVLPLEDRTITIKGNPAADPPADQATFTYLPGAFLADAASCPDLFNRDFRVAAELGGFGAGDEGILLAFGDHLAGFSVFVQGGRLVFDYNASGAHSVATTVAGVAEGATLLEVSLRSTGPRTATATLSVDGHTVAEGTVSPTVLSGVNMTGIQCGQGRLTPVSERYTNPFPYTGHLRRVTVHLGPKAADADEAAFAAAMRDQ